MKNVYDAYKAGQNGLGKIMARCVRPRLMLRTFMAVVCLLCGTATYAYDFEVDGIYYNILSSEDKTCTVTFSGGVIMPGI